MVDYPIYNPLDYGNLAKNVADKLMEEPVHPLPLAERFQGAGVYALFYDGDFQPYGQIRSLDATLPIYVGKAVPEGARKGTLLGSVGPLNDNGPFLYNRISDHARSIAAVDNLGLSDFSCRFLRVTPVWITMAERLLIERYRPIWNVCLDGFGLHDPGRGRSPIVSWWDALHPNRPRALGWTANIQRVRSVQDAIAHLRNCVQTGTVDVVGSDNEANE